MAASDEIRAAANTVPGLARDYLALLGEVSADTRRVTDKNPFNFLRLGFIHLGLPGARFIHCRRDPMRRRPTTHRAVRLPAPS